MSMRTGSPWAECYICGLDFPQSQMVRHYKSRRLVDKGCADEIGAAELRENLTLPKSEGTRRTENAVDQQGQAPDLYSDQDTLGGAGLGGEPFSGGGS